jgi:hypothetical protein
MKLEQMLQWGSHWLVIMDHAGEIFKDFHVPVDELPFLIRTPTTFMLLSIPQIRKADRGESIDQLLNIYIETMLKHDVNFRKRRTCCR